MRSRGELDPLADRFGASDQPVRAGYDYGQDGIGAYVWAETAADVAATFDAQVVNELSRWLNGHTPRLISVDVDDSPSNGLPRRSQQSG